MSESLFNDGVWAIVEMLGHKRMAGKITEVELFGSKLGRIDIPIGDTYVTQFFGGSSVYRITPTTEEIARSVADHNKPSPVYLYELPVTDEMKALPSVPDDDLMYLD